jgi:hypothetical protein
MHKFSPMKSVFFMMGVVAFLLLALNLRSSVSYKMQAARAGDIDRRPVVVELFTSEGCSTCPPADALLAKLEDRQPVEGAHVIALEEHVDYWNQQGWIDPYSSAEWTERQREYVSKFKSGEVYTPQMVVDGQQQFVGSRESDAEQAIQQSASRPKTEVTVTAQPPTKDRIQQFQVRVGKLIGNEDRDTAEIWLAVTEQGLESAVSNGENAGKNLRHSSALRTLRKIGVAPAGGESSSAFEASPVVKFKSDWKKQNIQIVVFVQEKKSRRILGAAFVGAVN